MATQMTSSSRGVKRRTAQWKSLLSSARSTDSMRKHRWFYLSKFKTILTGSSKRPQVAWFQASTVEANWTIGTIIPSTSLSRIWASNSTRGTYPSEATSVSSTGFKRSREPTKFKSVRPRPTPSISKTLHSPTKDSPSSTWARCIPSCGRNPKSAKTPKHSWAPRILSKVQKCQHTIVSSATKHSPIS